MAGQYTLTKNIHTPITIEFSEVFDKKKMNIARVQPSPDNRSSGSVVNSEELKSP